MAAALVFGDDLRTKEQHERRRASRLSSTTMAVVSEPYTTLICDSVEKYHTRRWRVPSHSSPAVTPPMSAWRHVGRLTGITM